MSKNIYGKKFEKKFYDDYRLTVPREFIYRLKDMMGKYKGKGGSNPCDFICHCNGII